MGTDGYIDPECAPQSNQLLSRPRQAPPTRVESISSRLITSSISHALRGSPAEPALAFSPRCCCRPPPLALRVAGIVRLWSFGNSRMCTHSALCCSSSYRGSPPTTRSAAHRCGRHLRALLSERICSPHRPPHPHSPSPFRAGPRRSLQAAPPQRAGGYHIRGPKRTFQRHVRSPTSFSNNCLLPAPSRNHDCAAFSLTLCGIPLSLQSRVWRATGSQQPCPRWQKTASGFLAMGDQRRCRRGPMDGGNAAGAVVDVICARRAHRLES